MQPQLQHHLMKSIPTTSILPNLHHHSPTFTCLRFKFLVPQLATNGSQICNIMPSTKAKRAIDDHLYSMVEVSNQQQCYIFVLSPLHIDLKDYIRFNSLSRIILALPPTTTRGFNCLLKTKRLHPLTCHHTLLQHH